MIEFESKRKRFWSSEDNREQNSRFDVGSLNFFVGFWQKLSFKPSSVAHERADLDVEIVLRTPALCMPQMCGVNDVEMPDTPKITVCAKVHKSSEDNWIIALNETRSAARRGRFTLHASAGEAEVSVVLFTFSPQSFVCLLGNVALLKSSHKNVLLNATHCSL